MTEHQMGAATWLAVQYWVEGASSPRMHNVLMVGSCVDQNSLNPSKIEALVLTDTGRLVSIGAYMKNMDAPIYKIVDASQPKERTR